MMSEMNEQEVGEALGPEMRFALLAGDEVVRVRVKKISYGPHFALDGELTSGSGRSPRCRIEVHGDTAELVTDSGRKALDVDSMVLSSVGRGMMAVGRRGGGMSS